MLSEVEAMLPFSFMVVWKRLNGTAAHTTCIAHPQRRISTAGKNFLEEEKSVPKHVGTQQATGDGLLAGARTTQA